MMAILKACTLKALVLRGCRRLTDASLQVAGRTQSALTMLDMSHSSVFSDGGLHLLLLAPALQVLNAGYCPKLSDQGIRRLVSARFGCCLRQLNLTDTRVTRDTLLLVVAQRTCLELLIVAGLQLTDDDKHLLLNAALSKRHAPKTTPCSLASSSAEGEIVFSSEDCKGTSGEGAEGGKGEGGKDERETNTHRTNRKVEIITQWEKEGRFLVLPSFT
jgi:hypothetical protein